MKKTAPPGEFMQSEAPAPRKTLSTSPGKFSKPSMLKTPAKSNFDLYKKAEGVSSEVKGELSIGHQMTSRGPELSIDKGVPLIPYHKITAEASFEGPDGGAPFLSGKPTQYVLWTGGYDSTCVVLNYLDAGYTVQPIYMRHSPGWAKSINEERTQDLIRNHLDDSRLLPTIIWDHSQLILVPGANIFWRALDELGDAVEVSHQYSALRFCMEVTGFKEKLCLGIVIFDELWERMEFVGAGLDSPLRKFFSQFRFPIMDKMKRTLWEQASPARREVLKLTVSCENGTLAGATCRQTKNEVKQWCAPCRRRVEDLQT